MISFPSIFSPKMPGNPKKSDQSNQKSRGSTTSARPTDTGDVKTSNLIRNDNPNFPPRHNHASASLKNCRMTSPNRSTNGSPLPSMTLSDSSPKTSSNLSPSTSSPKKSSPILNASTSPSSPGTLTMSHLNVPQMSLLNLNQRDALPDITSPRGLSGSNPTPRGNTTHREKFDTRFSLRQSVLTTALPIINGSSNHPTASLSPRGAASLAPPSREPKLFARANQSSKSTMNGSTPSLQPLIIVDSSCVPAFDFRLDLSPKDPITELSRSSSNEPLDNGDSKSDYTCDDDVIPTVESPTNA